MPELISKNISLNYIRNQQANIRNSGILKIMLFEFSYAPGTTQEQILGFEMAGQIWSSYLTDNVTVNIHVEISNQLPTNVLGGALPGIQAKYKFDEFLKNLAKKPSQD